MKVLDRKMLRDFVRLWAQSLAIALVLGCGVASFVLSYGVKLSLTETQSTFYERNRFADIWASATRAPNSLITQIERIKGVVIAEPRISQFAILDVEGLSEPAAAKMIALPKSGNSVLNMPSVTLGRMPSPNRTDEILVSENFATSNGFALGDTVVATLNGQKRVLRIVGTALSPEFIYLLGPGSMMPDDRRFGVIWMDRDTLAAAFDLEGAFNEVTLKLALGANENKVKDALETLLAPYGGTGPYGRTAQTSHVFLDAELDQLDTMSRILPPLFFIISAFLVNMVIGRLIALEREQIGLFKAVGYTNSQVAWHYVKIAIGIGVFGTVMGWGVGAWAGHGLSKLYAQFFHFPYLIYVTSPNTYILSGAAGIAAAILGALQSVLRTTKLSPAVAMSPPAPVRFRQNLFDKFVHMLGARQTVMMILRSITRWPMRAALTVLGVSLSGAILISTLFMFDALDEILDTSFFQANRQQATITLTGNKPYAILEDALNLPGVMRSEGLRSVPARLRNGHLEKLIGIEGRAPGMDLSRVLNAENGAVVLPDKGIILSGTLAESLGVTVGDMLEIEVLEGQRETYFVPITAIIEQYFGLGAYMNLGYLSALLQQAPQVNAINISLDENQLDALYDAVKDTPGIAGLVLWKQIRQSFNDTIAENSGMTTTIYALVASLIVVGVVYNSARIQLSERARELASLRILGFTKGEVSFILLGELMLLTLIAIPLGFVIGRFFAFLIVSGFSSDLYTIPLVINNATYGFSGVVVFVASLASALLVRRRINRLDLISVMKTRE